jgi:hypothetical protein
LGNAQEGKTKAMRQMRFDDDHIPDLNILKSYVDKAEEAEELTDGSEEDWNDEFDGYKGIIAVALHIELN